MLIEVKYNLFMMPDGYWRFQSWVSQCGDNDDPNIFVHQRLPRISNNDTQLEDIFVDIANRAEMDEFPPDAPEGNISFFRKKFMDISLRDSTEMQSAVALIERDIKLLTETYEVIT